MDGQAWSGVIYSIASFWAVAAAAPIMARGNRLTQNMIVLITWAIALSLPIARPPTAAILWGLCFIAPAATAAMWKLPALLGAGPIAAGAAAIAAMKPDALVLGVSITAISIGVGVFIEYTVNPSRIALGAEDGTITAMENPMFSKTAPLISGLGPYQKFALTSNMGDSSKLLRKFF